MTVRDDIAPRAKKRRQPTGCRWLTSAPVNKRLRFGRLGMSNDLIPNADRVVVAISIVLVTADPLPRDCHPGFFALAFYVRSERASTVVARIVATQ
jgi:hypothetical protein